MAMIDTKLTVMNKTLALLRKRCFFNNVQMVKAYTSLKGFKSNTINHVLYNQLLNLLKRLQEE